MARHNYRTALRAKGIKPIPPHHRLRSHLGALDPAKHHVLGERPTDVTRINFSVCRGDRFCRGRCRKPGAAL